VPQAEQKNAELACSEPQAGHGRYIGAPQALQKRASSGCSAAQEAQAMVTKRVYGATAVLPGLARGEAKR
jgi:hypothetical protein